VPDAIFDALGPLFVAPNANCKYNRQEKEDGIQNTGDSRKRAESKTQENHGMNH
jgi:hypothetical protein